MKEQFIVIDGLDGSGKATQTARLADFLTKRKYPVKTLTFPNYDSPSSALVQMYLQGKIAQESSSVNPYAASSFYACDRYIGYITDWCKNYQKHDVLLSDRYVSSNLIHQMAKLSSNEWDKFMDWLYDYEYNKLGLPRPHLTIYLDMNPMVSQKLLNSRYAYDMQKKDIHERDFIYLSSCRKAALYAAQRDNWAVVSCDDGEQPYSIEETFSKIQKILGVSNGISNN